MKYIIMQTQTDTNSGNVTRTFTAPIWDTAKAAHDFAKSVNMRDYRVFPDTSDVNGLDVLARAMTRTACKLLIEKTSADNVSALHLLHRIRAATYAANVTDHDALDCMGAATLETWAAIVDGANVFDQAARGLSAVYRHIRGERGYFNGRREKLLHLDGMTDADAAYWGALVDTIAEELEKEEEEHKPRENAPRLMDCVNERLTDAQRSIMLLLSEGMTQSQVARVMGRSVGTISHHVRLSRATLAAYMKDNNMPMPDGVTDADIAALIANAERRKAANADSANAAHKAARQKK